MSGDWTQKAVITLAASLPNCGKGGGGAEELLQLKTSVMGGSGLSPFLAIPWYLPHRCVRVKSRKRNTTTRRRNVFVLLLSLVTLRRHAERRGQFNDVRSLWCVQDFMSCRICIEWTITLKNKIFAYLVNTFPAGYGNRRFILHYSYRRLNLTLTMMSCPAEHDWCCDIRPFFGVYALYTFDATNFSVTEQNKGDCIWNHSVWTVSIATY